VSTRDDGDGAATVARWVESAGRVTVLTGAGISTDSGIPDFRGPQGVWTRDPQAQRLFTLSNYVGDPEIRRQAWSSRREHPAWTAQPNAAHLALVELERGGRLQALITQNIDGLHQRAGTSPQLVVEVHGSLFGVMCLTCSAHTPMAAALDRVAAGDPDPACLDCGGILKSATVSFGQSLVPEVLERARRAAVEAEVFLAVGSSLTVQPVAGLVRIAAAGGARVAIVNASPTPYDDLAEVVLREPVGIVLPRLVGALAG